MDQSEQRIAFYGTPRVEAEAQAKLIGCEGASDGQQMACSEHPADHAEPQRQFGQIPRTFR